MKIYIFTYRVDAEVETMVRKINPNKVRLLVITYTFTFISIPATILIMCKENRLIT